METGRVTADDTEDYSADRLIREGLAYEDELEKRRRAAAEVPAKPYKRAPQLVGAIMARARDPWVDLDVGGEVLARVRVGSTVVVIGASGSGKSSLVLGICVRHAEHIGPAIVLSIELPEDEAAARIVGQKCAASWEEALTGQVSLEAMERALSCERLFVLDRRRATLKNLEATIDDARAEYPDEPILVAIDYAQLLESKEREVRMRVADAFAQIDDCAREKKFVALALSQMSRANAQRARSGEILGTESASAGAESAAIEQWATLTLTIGKAVEREDGTDAVELSVGKARMRKGDRVFPMTYEGRTGRWSVAGKAKRAEEVREQRVTERAKKDDATIEAAMVMIAQQSPVPLSRRELKGKISGNSARKTAAIDRLLAKSDAQPHPPLVEISRRAKGARKGDWMVWTPERARAAGIATVADVVNGTLLEGLE